MPELVGRVVQEVDGATEAPPKRRAARRAAARATEQQDRSARTQESPQNPPLDPELREDLDAVWPQLEAGMRYLRDR